MSRHLRSVLPTTPNQLTPKIIVPSQVSEQLKKKQLIHKKYYDQGSRPLSELKPNDTVYMQAGNCWIPATVTQKANTPHSYAYYENNRWTLLPPKLSISQNITSSQVSSQCADNINS